MGLSVAGIIANLYHERAFVRCGHYCHHQGAFLLRELLTTSILNAPFLLWELLPTSTVNGILLLWTFSANLHPEWAFSVVGIAFHPSS